MRERAARGRQATATRPRGPRSARRRVRVIEYYGSPPVRPLPLAQLARTTPVLATLHREQQASWPGLPAPEIALRPGADPHDATDPRPRALIAAALSRVEVIIGAWAASNGTQQLPQILSARWTQFLYRAGCFRMDPKINITTTCGPKTAISPNILFGGSSAWRFCNSPRDGLNQLIAFRHPRPDSPLAGQSRAPVAGQ